MRLFDMRSRQPIPPSAFGKEYTGSAANPRLYAHTMADEIHQSQRALRGVARTKLTFNSDRDGERMGGTIESRSVKEIYIADYDGENQRRLTVQKSLNITSTWSPDARSIAYTSYRRGLPNIFISNIFQGTLEELTKERSSNNCSPSWSPDGTRLCFASTRDGNMEIYVVNRDGSNLRRLTNHPGGDITPHLVAVRHADRVHVGPHRHAADLHRRRRWSGASEADVRAVRRSADVVAGAVQRSRVHARAPGRATTSRS